MLPAAQEHVLAQEDGKHGCKGGGRVVKAFALAVPHDKALEIRDDVGFFQAVRSVLMKNVGDGQRSPEELDLSPSGRSSPRRWLRMRSSTSSRRPG